MANFGDRNAGFQAGNIFGSVTNTFHAPPVLRLERRETPPQPSIVIPFARDADFVERGPLLDELCKKCALPDARLAIVGLGGVGKSQLVIELAYRTREQSPETWVLWVHASNAARLEQSFRDIADRVKIAGRQDPQVNILKLVHDWLCNSRQPWLLVLDNVEGAGFLLEAQTASSKTAARPLREYLPHCERGSILVTARNKEATLQLVEQRDIVTLDPMNEAQSLALLTRKLGAQADRSYGAELAGLAAALEYMPLAIVQAAAYISQRAPLCSVAQYLDQFRKSERKRTNLLDHDGGQLRRDREAKNSIITTWQISFEHIQQVRPSAANLLSLMSFFDRQGIPKNVLQTRAEYEESEVNQRDDSADAIGNARDSEVQSKRKDGDVEERSNNGFENDSIDYSEDDDVEDDDVEDDDVEDDDVKDDDSKDDAFYEDVTALRNFYFISINTDGTSFEMHALVQLSMRVWLAANSQLKRYKEQFISTLCPAFPTGNYENWPACQALFAHAKAAASQKPEATSSLVEWATLLYRAAWYAESKGSAAEAQTLAMQSMKVRKKVLGQDHEDTIWSIAIVADAYSLGGRWDEAEKLREQVIETRKKKLGADHPDTLTSMANLALTYQNQGRWDAAEELFMQVIETRKKKLGADHPDTLTSMANLAWIYKSLERNTEAVCLLQECVRLSFRTLRAEHPDLVLSQEILAGWEAEQAIKTLIITAATSQQAYKNDSVSDNNEWETDDENFNCGSDAEQV